MKKLFYIIIIFLLSINGYGQNQHIIDSLQNELKKFEAHKKEIGIKVTALMDSAKVNVLDSIGMEYWNIDLDTAIVYAQQELSLAIKIGYKKGMGTAYNSFGVINIIKGNLPKAHEYFQKGLRIFEEIGYKLGMAWIYSNIGAMYQGQHDYAGALKNYNAALKIYEDIGIQNSISVAYNNIGILYENQGNYPEALKNQLAALKVREETGDKNGIINSGNSIEGLYLGMGNYTEALKIQLKTLKIQGEIGDKKGTAHSYNNIGGIYEFQGNYLEALKNYQVSLKLREEIADKNGIANSYNNIGGIYKLQGNYSEAIRNQLIALKLQQEVGDSGGIADSYYCIGAIYTEQGNYSEALKNYFNELKIYEETGSKDGIAKAYNEIGKVYKKNNQPHEALKYESKRLSLVLELGETDNIKDSYKELAVINAKLQNYKAAYDDEVLFKQYYDSIYNKDNEKKLTGLQMKYDFDKVQDSTKAEQDKKDLISFNEIKRQKNVRNYTLAGLGIVLLFSIVVYRQRNKISKEKKRSDDLLLNILPEEVAEELKEKGSAEAKLFDDVTVMFTDFKGFTTIAEKLSAKELVGEINYCFSAFDNIIHKYGIEKIKTIGDSYMAVGGLPVANKTHAKDVVNAAIEINKFMEEHKKQRIQEGKEIFEIRIGIHTGPVVAGIVGIKKFAYDIWGDTVNLASRMESSGEAGKVNISGYTYELVKNDFTFIYRGKIQAKNKGEVDMYFVSEQ